MENAYKNLCSVAESQLTEILRGVEELERKYTAVPIFGTPNTNEDLYNDIMEPFTKLKAALSVDIQAAHTGATFEQK